MPAVLRLSGMCVPPSFNSTPSSAIEIPSNITSFDHRHEAAEIAGAEAPLDDDAWIGRRLSSKSPVITVDRRDDGALEW
jgi:hypothetical protein